MKVLVTRAAEEGRRLAQTLGALGFEPVVEPLLRIRFLPDGPARLAPLLPGAQAVLFTSGNGARAFAAATDRRDLRAFAVGDATAAAARAAGFPEVASARGNVEDLARLAATSLQPEDGALIHAAGSVAAGDLAGFLGAARFSLRRAVLYEAKPAEALSDSARAAFMRGEIAAALFFSPRTAATFVRLAPAIRSHCAAIVAVALSDAVADELRALPWRRIAVAASPDEAALLAALQRSLQSETST